MGTFDDRKANCLINLNNVEFLSGQYQNRTSQLATLVGQRKTLEGRIQAAKAKKQDTLESAQAYEKEFLDRSATQKLPTPGLATFQDGILFAFFIVLASVFVVILYIMIKMGNPLYLGFTVFVLLTSGILIAELIRRFA